MTTPYMAYALLANGALDGLIYAGLVPAWNDFFRTSPSRKSASTN